MNIINLKFKKFIFAALFIYIVSAINNPINYLDSFTIKSTISFIRGIAPLIILLISFYLIIYNFKNLKIDIIYKLFILYLISQIPYYFLNSFITFAELSWVLSGLGLIFLFLLIQNENIEFNKIFLNIFLIILFLISFKFSLDLYYNYFSNYRSQPFERTSFYGFYTMAPNNSFLSQPVPRSSGLGRMLAILWIFLISLLIYKKKLEVKYKYFLIAIIFFLSFTIYHLQSRLILIFFISFIIFFVIFDIYEMNFKRKINLIILIFILPFILHLYEYKIRNSINFYFNEKQRIAFQDIQNFISTFDYINTERILDKEKKIIDQENLNNLNTKKELGSLKFKTDEIKNQRLYHKNLSGRKELWLATIELTKINNFLGYGPHADRILLDQNVSGLYFYALICGGIISFFSIILINIILGLKILKLLFFDKILLHSQDNGILQFSLITILFLFTRTIGEISYGVFGIDMIMFLICYNLISKYK